MRAIVNPYAFIEDSPEENRRDPTQRSESHSLSGYSDPAGFLPKTRLRAIESRLRSVS